MTCIQSFEIYNYTQNNLKKLSLTEKDCVLLFFLDTNYSIISTHTYFKNLKKPLSVSEVFIPGFYVHATYVFLVAYFPNRKNLLPKNEEAEFYSKLKKTEKSFGIVLQDFLIISKKSYFSFFKNKITSHV